MPESDDLIPDLVRPEYNEVSLTDFHTVLDFGKYKGTKAGFVPGSYLIWAEEEEIITMTEELRDQAYEEDWAEDNEGYDYGEDPYAYCD